MTKTIAKWYKRLWWKILRLFVLPSVIVVDNKREVIKSTFTRSYSSISGIDVKIFFKGKQLSFVEGISFDTIEMKGAMVAVLFGSTGEVQKALLGKPGRLYLRAGNEHGDLDVLFDGEVKFKGEQWGMTVDDIVLSKTLPFEILSSECPTSLNREGRCNNCGLEDTPPGILCPSSFCRSQLNFKAVVD
ncbi:MAG: hypothetical protein DRH90_21580, partial [Deltaproteobacteria bacterium]